MLLTLLHAASAFMSPPPGGTHYPAPPASGARPPEMLSNDLYLGIDCGTQGLKAVVYDAVDKKTVGVGSVAYGLNPTDVIGRAEQDPAVWVDALYTAAAEALSAAGGSAAAAAVRGIGVSGQQHGLVALDDSYRVLRPSKLWCDTESAGEAAELSKLLGREVVSSFTFTKLLWMKRNEPELFGKLAHVALPHDYLNYELTGSLVAECGDASGTGLLDTSARAWDAKAAGLIDASLLPMLPPLIGPTDAAGELSAVAAGRLGVRAGVPVSAGSGDNMMSALGCGCSVEGRVAISLGTSGTIFGKTAAAADDPTGAVCPFLDATGGGLPLMCTLNCASVPEEVRSGYGLDRDRIADLASAEAVGSEGLSFLPYLAGERTPNWPHASGALVGIRAGQLSRPGLVYRAALEGVTFSLRAGLGAMRSHGMAGIGEARLVGGGSKSALWRQIVADALQLRVAVPAVPESAARGAALQAAAMAAGVRADEIGGWISSEHDCAVENVVEPSADPAVAQAYDEAYARYDQHGRALFEGGA